MFGRRLGHPACPVELRPSRLTQGGTGVFARVAIPIDAFITPFDGKRVPVARPIPPASRPYAYGLPCERRLLVPYLSRASRQFCGVGHLLNDAIHTCVTGSRNNCYFDEIGRGDCDDDNVSVWIRAETAIEAGDELLVSYGAVYWLASENLVHAPAHLRDWWRRQRIMHEALESPAIAASVSRFCDMQGDGTYVFKVDRPLIIDTRQQQSPVCVCACTCHGGKSRMGVELSPDSTHVCRVVCMTCEGHVWVVSSRGVTYIRSASDMTAPGTLRSAP